MDASSDFHKARHLIDTLANRNFQALQQVEWRWHAMIQLATQLAAALSWWGKGQVGHWYLLASVGLKALVVGVVSMHRLDDKRLVRLSKLFCSTRKPCGLADAYEAVCSLLCRRRPYQLLDSVRGSTPILADWSMCWPIKASTIN